MNDKSIEKEIQDKGLTAPRVTPDRLEEVIKDEQYHVFPGSTFTSCLLTLENGFTVHGESACASPENFDAELGAKIARDNAKSKIWALEGYLLKQKLFEEPTDFKGRLVKEHAELSDKAGKLKGFIGTDAFKAIDDNQRELLEEQLNAMIEYGHILEVRLELLG